MLMCAHHTTAPATHFATLSLLPIRGADFPHPFRISLCAACVAAFRRTHDFVHLENLKRICVPPLGRALPHAAPNPPNGDKTNEPTTIDETTPD